MAGNAPTSPHFVIGQFLTTYSSTDTSVVVFARPHPCLAIYKFIDFSWESITRGPLRRYYFFTLPPFYVFSVRFFIPPIPSPTPSLFETTAAPLAACIAAASSFSPPVSLPSPLLLLSAR
jgi:hypothetical protein